ncbi:MAG: hypothetical protein Q7S23_05420, partial [bacterium]|nr:hypothetical protein [bacterium]
NDLWLMEQLNQQINMQVPVTVVSKDYGNAQIIAQKISNDTGINLINPSKRAGFTDFIDSGDYMTFLEGG